MVLSGEQKEEDKISCKGLGSNDKLISAKIREARLERGMSMNKLGEEINRLGNERQCSFQQLQKYELGVNRVPAGRLGLIAKALNKNIGYFFDDIYVKSEEETMEYLCVAVGSNFAKLKSESSRKMINDMIKALVKEEKERKG